MMPFAHRGPGHAELTCNSITVIPGEPNGESRKIMDDDNIMKVHLRIKVIAGYIGRLVY